MRCAVFENCRSKRTRVSRARDVGVPAASRALINNSDLALGTHAHKGSRAAQDGRFQSRPPVATVRKKLSSPAHPVAQISLAQNEFLRRQVSSESDFSFENFAAPPRVLVQRVPSARGHEPCARRCSALKFECENARASIRASVILVVALNSFRAVSAAHTQTPAPRAADFPSEQQVAVLARRRVTQAFSMASLMLFQFEATTEKTHRCAARPFTTLRVLIETRPNVTRLGSHLVSAFFPLT